MKYAKVKTLIVSCIRNMCKTNKQKTRECKTSRPSQVIHNHIIIILFILYFKFKYDEYNILLKQLIQLCYNTCPVRY